MVKINIICVGNIKEKYLRQACDEYKKRLSAYCKINILEVKEFKVSSNPNDKQIKTIVDKEGQEILNKIKNGYVIGLFIDGDTVSSEKLAEKIDKIISFKSGEIYFIIGGSFGLSEDVKKHCDFKLSFSKMTFPHMLMRVMLLEQLYRVFNILNNGQYHK